MTDPDLEGEDKAFPFLLTGLLQGGGIQVDPIMETKGLTIAFGGHVAVQDVSFSVKRNEFKSIIGPNGAGKTTLFNLLSGQLKPVSGKIIFNGEDVTALPPIKRTRKGIGRSFQLNNVFPNLTVYENVRLAVQSEQNVRYQMFRHFKSFKAINEKTGQLLDMILLNSKADSLASNLAHGEQRKLEIAMLLALDPELLLLDEPTAGMAIEEVPAILDVIRAIKEKGDRTIVLIEHKMDMVMDLSDSIMVLHSGEMLADGPPRTIMENETVQTAYLGGFQHGVS